MNIDERLGPASNPSSRIRRRNNIKDEIVGMVNEVHVALNGMWGESK